MSASTAARPGRFGPTLAGPGRYAARTVSDA